jgi:class 3 adenylate cyclase/DNA-binding beta-propeller fold protein YncE
MPRRSQAPERLLTTVLFTDIVGSTERAAEMGDKQWRRIISAHHALVRRQLKRFNGREVDTAGDGFFATFDQPAQAIRCAEAVVTDVRRLGIQVRAGVHMGEVEAMGPKVGGIAVHIGARIMSKAAPGQVLVSSTVRDLMSGSDLKFEDVGSHELKGVPSQWRLYRVEQPPQTEADAEQPLAVAEEPARRAGFPTISALIVIGVVLVLVIPLVLVLRGHGGPSFTVGADTVVRIAGGRVSGGAHVGHTPTTVAFGDGRVWVANFDDSTIQWIDPKTQQPSPAQGGLPGNPTGITVGGGFVWVTFGLAVGEVVQIDPTQRNVVKPISVGTGVAGIAFGDGFAWAVNGQTDELLKIDPTSASVVDHIPLDTGSGANGVAEGGGYVWVAESLTGALLRVSATDSTDSVSIPLPSSGAGQQKPHPEQVAFGAGFVWVTDTSLDQVTRINPDALSGGTSTITGVGDGPVGIAAGPQGVWVANSLDGTAAQIDPQTRQVIRRVKVGDFSVEGVTESSDAIWVTVHSRS